MKQLTRNYYRVHVGFGSEDCADCATLADAELRQAEIRANQIAGGYKPDKTHIYLHTWCSVIDEDKNIVLSENKTVVFVK